jgi:CubicO group peptidase (beta-lactamase class C family)
MASANEVHGYCDPRFSRVEEIFRDNVARGDELGASFTVYHGDELVVDLWGGLADGRTGRAWEGDTPCPLFSTTKTITATAVLVLWERGVLDLEAPVASWWPEFGRHGKEKATGVHLMSHQAGLPCLETQLSLEESADAERVAALLAGQTPVWEPGTAHGYHSLTYGWLLDEAVRRHTGRGAGEFLAAEVTGPRKLDVWVGAPDEVIARAAKVGALPPPPQDLGDPPADATDGDDPHLAHLPAQYADPESLVSRSFASPSMVDGPGGVNNPLVLRLGWPAIAGLATGTGLAGFYRDLVAGRILAPDTLRRAIAPQVSGIDQVFGVNLAFGLGYLRPCPPVFYGPPQAERSIFGHFGAGGGFGLGDIDNGLAVSYLPNGMRGQVASFSRPYRMVEAVYGGIGLG